MAENIELFRKMMLFSRKLRMGGKHGMGPGPGGRESFGFPGTQGPGEGRGDFGGMHPRHRFGEDHPEQDPDRRGKGPHGHGGRHHRGMSRERLLVIIGEHPEGIWQKDIAEAAGINASSTSELIAKLEEDGYLLRETDENDKRATLLKLSEAGKARAEEIRAERGARLDALFAKLTEEEKQTLSDLLDKILN